MPVEILTNNNILINFHVAICKSFSLERSYLTI